jgi:hypothetical protein
MVVFSLVVCIPAYAQIVGQWVDGHFLVNDLTGPRNNNISFGKILLDADGNIRKSIPNIANVVDSSILRRNREFSVWSYWHNDSLYTLAWGLDEKDENGSEFTRYIFARWDEDEWHLLGDFKTDTQTMLQAIPCDNDKFIVISSKFLGNNNSENKSPFYWMSIHPSV